MEFKIAQLQNGLTIIGELNASAKSAAIGFFVKAGARDETSQINGVSHFLEHMLFKGTEKLNAFEVSRAFDKTGAKFNAFTSEENTVYYAAVLPEYLAEITTLWSELLRPALRDDDFNIEKNVIKEEIAMYKDFPSFDVTDRARSLHFQGHPCQNSVLGTETSIDSLTAEQMRDYFTSRYYALGNMIVTVVGNFDWDHIRQILQAECSGWQTQQLSRQLSDCKGSFKQKRVEKPNLACEHICLVSHAVSAQDPKRFACRLLACIIGDSVGSRFFWELIDKAIAETAVMQSEVMDATGALFSYIRCSNENVTQVLDIVDAIFKNIADSGISDDELNKAKNKILSALVIKNEMPMGRLVDVGFNWTYLKQYRSVEDDIVSIKSVTVDEVNSLIKQLNPARYTKVSIGPAKPAG
jgi:predicted Zn-dependent peptidase